MGIAEEKRKDDDVMCDVGPAKGTSSSVTHTHTCLTTIGPRASYPTDKKDEEGALPPSAVFAESKVAQVIGKEVSLSKVDR